MDASVTTVQATLPTRLLAEAELLIAEGWFQDRDDLIADALRRFLDAHRPELMERYIQEDVEWGLHGRE
jgi:metal-responsive CopG/Arc/MetJ family transcriptional regulator